MKSQGLPLNFIVLAAIAILILILVVGFVIGGGGAVEGSISPAAARSNCQRWCSELQMEVRRNADYDISSSSFCENQQVVDGAETNCEDLGIDCVVTYPNGTSSIASCNENI